MNSNEPRKIRLYVAEEHEIFREAYKSIFSFKSAFDLLGISASADPKAMKQALSTLDLDVLLISMKKLDEDNIMALNQIRKEFPAIGIALIFMSYNFNDITVLRRFASGARAGLAVFLKQSLERVDQLCGVIKSVSEGQVILDPALTSRLFAEKQGNPLLRGLTPRELEILNLIACGYTNQAIAESICIDIKTVHHHINNIYSKVKADADLDNRHVRVSVARLYLQTTGELLAAGIPE